jgi:hypothetical protein
MIAKDAARPVTKSDTELIRDLCPEFLKMVDRPTPSLFVVVK